MQLGLIGLGKMGGFMAERIHNAGHEVVGFDFSAEVAPLPLAWEHGLTLLCLQDAPDGRGQSVPLGGFLHQLLAPGRCQ